jgi:hypothetical protein
MRKVHGSLVGIVDGLTVTVALKKPRGKGKERLWIQIRQNNGKKWRVYTCLAYARSLDVQFVAEPD